MPLLRALVLAASLLSVPAFAGPPAPAEAVAPARLAERMRGEWVIALSAQEQRSLDLMLFALADPVPTDAQIAAKGLTPEEAMMVGAIVEMRRQDPADSKLAEMGRVVADLPNTTLSISADHLTFGLAGHTASGSYEVLEETADHVKIRHHPPDGPPKEAVLSFDGDVLVMADGDKAAVHFKRR